MVTYQQGLFEILGDASRRSILELVATRPLAVGDLAERLPISRPAVSQHLKVLKDAGLVTATAAGTRRLYLLDPSGLAPLRAWLAQFWDDNLAAFTRAVEDERELT
ncbi:MAG: Transcriptional regulator, ArsR family [Frankiales bacterium]|nr:Transcriptional regulator, ArsR family [Frankiales bacterium]